MARQVFGTSNHRDRAKPGLLRRRNVTLKRCRMRTIILILLGALTLTSCGQWPSRPETLPNNTKMGAGTGAKLATIAQRELGIPYRYGGSSPSGFDCSGLVYYVHQQAGIAVPRTVADQFQRARSVRFSELQPGDLLFFHLASRGISHVGIYTGGRRFIHAPQGGKDVSVGSLETDYWRTRLMAAGRYY